MKTDSTKMIFTALISLVFFITISLIFISQASGRPFRMGIIPDKGSNFSCDTCHAESQSKKIRNPFGKDYERIGIAAGDKYTDDLGKMDSDGDGFSNDKEFKAGSNPGDPQSKP